MAKLRKTTANIELAKELKENMKSFTLKMLGATNKKGERNRTRKLGWMFSLVSAVAGT